MKEFVLSQTTLFLRDCLVLIYAMNSNDEDRQKKPHKNGRLRKIKKKKVQQR